MSSGKPGRRPGDPEITKQAILDAARRVFGRVGYERATMRLIAGEAGVDPGLIHHYFGTKQGLFTEVHEIPFDPARIVDLLTDGPPEELGRRLVRFYLTVFGAPGSPAVSMVRSAATNHQAAEMLREFVEDVLLSHAGELTTAARPRLRLALAGSHLLGIVFARNIVRLPELTDPDVDELVDIVSPAIQRYLVDPESVS